MSRMENEFPEEPSEGELKEIEESFDNSEKDFSDTDFQEDNDVDDEISVDGSNLGDDTDDEAVDIDDKEIEEDEEEPVDTTGDNGPFEFDDIGLLKAELSNYKRLSREEEIELVQKMEQGDSIARDILIYSNAWLAFFAANKYRYKGLRFEDKVSAGMMGVMNAVDKYDYRKGARLSTYATFYVNKYIMRAGWENGTTIRIPEQTALEINNMKKVRATLENQMCRKPTIDEIAKYMGVSSSKIRELVELEYKLVELQSPLDSEDGEGELLDRVADDDTPEQYSQLIEQRKMLGQIFQKLSDREKIVIELRYGVRPEDFDSLDTYLPVRKTYSFQEIGEKLGISKQAASQIAKKAFEKAKNRKG